jgi:hypothetical protein
MFCVARCCRVVGTDVVLRGCVVVVVVVVVVHRRNRSHRVLLLCRCWCRVSRCVVVVVNIPVMGCRRVCCGVVAGVALLVSL